MVGKLVLTIGMSVTSEDNPAARFYVDPEAVTAEDVIRVECRGTSKRKP